MNVPELVKGLRAAAKEFAPLTVSNSPGSLTWDGARYAPTRDARTPDPYALAWQVKLETLAAMIERQEGPLSSKQIDYLEHQLLGGMGSLQDLGFGSTSSESIARDVNERLEARLSDLYAILKER